MLFLLPRTLQANGEDLLLGIAPNSLVLDVSPLQQSAASRVKRFLLAQQQQQQKEEETDKTDDAQDVRQQEQQQHHHQPQHLPLCGVYFACAGETLVAAGGGAGGRGNAAFVSNKWAAAITCN